MKEVEPNKPIVVTIRQQDGKGETEKLLDTVWFFDPEVLEAWYNGLVQLIGSLQGIKLDQADKALLKETGIISEKLRKVLTKIDPEECPPLKD